jgi:hypothetical protein
MHDRPTPAELIDAVRRFLETELLPALGDARLRFQTLVAANALAIAGRELPLEEEHLREEWVRLRALLDLPEGPPATLAELRRAVRQGNEQLCARIRNGEFDDPQSFATLAQQLRYTVLRKLQVANPRYLASAAK